MNAWNIYLNNRIFDVGFFTGNCDSQYIKWSLVNHDGYDSRIIVRRARA